MEKFYGIREQIIEKSKSLGFDLVGFSSAKVDKKYTAAFRDWIKNRNEGKMDYLSEAERVAKRSDPRKVLRGAKSVVVLAMNYYRPQVPLADGSGRVARYAYGRDYHKIISKKLRQLENFICEIGRKNFPNKKIIAKSYVDTGPILERAFAEQAGLGVIGKNCCLITKDFGSWVFLAEIITNLDLAPKANSKEKSHASMNTMRGNFSACGACTRCRDACPMDAIIAPGVIDARKCISYFTIEHKGKIPKKLAGKISKTRRIFGCDICQEVCPHNISRQKPTTHKELLEPKIAGDQLYLKKILGIKTDAEFLKNFAGSPLMRAKRKGLRRNATLL